MNHLRLKLDAEAADVLWSIEDQQHKHGRRSVESAFVADHVEERLHRPIVHLDQFLPIVFSDVLPRKT